MPTPPPRFRVLTRSVQKYTLSAAHLEWKTSSSELLHYRSTRRFSLKHFPPRRRTVADSWVQGIHRDRQARSRAPLRGSWRLRGTHGEGSGVTSSKRVAAGYDAVQGGGTVGKQAVIGAKERGGNLAGHAGSIHGCQDAGRIRAGNGRAGFHGLHGRCQRLPGTCGSTIMTR